MEKTPILSVIIPAFNVEAYIRQAVDSALGQSWHELEVIVVDDGSTDGTMDVLHDIHDPRLRRFWQDHAGLAAARNLGIRNARGAYLGFLDGDDLWAAAKAERHISFFQNHPEIDLTFSYACLIDELGVEIAPIRAGCSREISFKTLLIECPLFAVLRREAIERAGLFDTDLVASEDLDMWLRIAMLRKGNIGCIREFLAYYRRRTGQLTGDLNRLEKAWQQLFEKHLRLAPAGIQESSAEVHQARYRYYAALAYDSQQYADSVRFLRASLRYAPWNALVNGRTWLLIAACLSGSLLPSALHETLKHGVAWWRRRYSHRD